MDPTTISAIIAAIADYVASKNTGRWQDDVSSRLDDIYRNTEIIIDELRALRVDQPAMLDSAFQREHVTQYASVFKNKARVIGDIMSGFPDISDRFPTNHAPTNEAISDIHNYCQENVGICIDRCGYSSYMAVATGASLFLIVAGWSRTPKSEMKTLYKLAADYLENCLNPSIPGSIAWAVDLLSSDRNAKINEGATYVRKGGLGINPRKREPRPPPGPGRIVNLNPFIPDIADLYEPARPAAITYETYVWVEISGGVQSAFTHGEFFGSPTPVYPNFPEVRGVTYGAEYGIEARMSFVMKATTEILEEFRKIDALWQKAVAHHTACRLCCSSLKEIASHVCP